MCTQCLCDSEPLDCPIEGMYLARVRKRSGEILPGMYLLGWINDPLVIINPTQDINNVGFINDELGIVGDCIVCTPYQGEALLKACRKSGYKKRDGSLEEWLLRRLNLPEIKN